VPVLGEGGPAKLLKNKNLSIHHIDFEPGGRPFESGRARKEYIIKTSVYNFSNSNISTPDEYLKNSQAIGKVPKCKKNKGDFGAQ
jgi:hypothetical protein